METETLPRRTVRASLCESSRVPGTYVLTAGSRSVNLSREALQAIVQQAGDAHGIIAQPWTDGSK